MRIFSTERGKRGEKSSITSRFVYFHVNRGLPDNVRQVIPTHVQYWKATNLPGCMDGPFADHTGGLISFMATDPEEAAAVAQQDPFILEDLIEQTWIKEWVMA